MNDSLLAEVEKRLDHAASTPGVKDCVLTACLEPEALNEPARSRSTRTRTGATEGAGGSRPARVFIESVTVEGFRGIGPQLTLNLAPGPGLTLIVGRNGTGKSSLSDALEVLLTGNSARWASKKSKIWQEGWRNLHHPDPTRVEARMVVEGVPGFTTVARQWAPGADLAKSTVTAARTGRPTAGFDSLGWQDALRSYRPFLSYSELGGLLEDGPSKLFDALNAILGLDDLTAATKALADARLEIERRAKQTAAELVRLRELLESSRDERATRLLAITGRVPRLDEIAALLETSVLAPTGGDHVELLRRLMSLDLPPSDEVAAVADRLAIGQRAVEMVAATDAGRARALAGLLDAAVAFSQHNQQHGDRDCPVCGQPQALSAGWRSHADAERARLRALATGADEAHLELDRALAAARSLPRPAPAALVSAGTVGIEASAALAGWQAWAAGPADDTAPGLAAHLLEIERWRDDVTVVQAEAAQQLADLEDSWRPIAEAAMAWLHRARADGAATAGVKDLKSAETWLKKTGEAIRAERFEPLAVGATRVWETLRQRSSVDIGGITLAGSTTTRRVKVDVSVDGSDGAALAVMSQGELHSLALALFLPRATLSESPFRFIVIDDPVQAMDPAKVEGLARVLEQTAMSHQVIVLTHDDRLPEAVRRLRVPATIVQVRRGTGSRVLIDKVLDPVDRHLVDARDVAGAKELPDEVKARVVPTLCRQALEATCVEIVRRRRLTRGDRHDDVERELAAANKLNKSFALAMFDDVENGGGVLPRLNEWDGQMAQTYQACNHGAHGSYVGDATLLVSDTRALVKKLQTLS